jgi:hypothetical protein
MNIRANCRLLGLLCFCCAGMIAPAAAQIPIQDALLLRKYVEPHPDDPTRFVFSAADTSARQYLPILLQYVDDQSDSAVFKLLQGFGDNPYLNDDAKDPWIVIPNTGQTKALIDGEVPVEFNTTPGQPRGLFVTNLADGLAKFLVSRTKEELNMAFFRRFRQWLNENDDYTSLFPATTDVIDLVGEDISYQYKIYLETLRTAFVKDMKTLPDNVAGFLLRTKLIESPATRLVVHDLLRVSQLLLDGHTPDSLLRYCAHSALIQGSPEMASLANDGQRTRIVNLASGLRLVNTMSESLRSRRSDEVWIDPDRLGRALADEVTLKLYLGLLYQQGAGIDFEGGRSFRTALRDVGALSDLPTKLRNFAEYGREVKTALRALRHGEAADSASYDTYYRFFSATFSAVGEAFELKNDFAQLGQEQQEYEQNYLRSIRYLNELNFDSRRLQYTSAITNVVGVLDLLVFRKDNEQHQNLRQGLLRYGNFIAVVAQARRSDEIAAAIEAVALPPGSSAVKKHNKFSVAINAYTGLAGGGERLQINSAERQKGFLAVSAPVGITFSWGLPGEWAPSFSLYTPVLDVGAIAAYRFDNATKKLPELEWSNLLAPGLYGVLGLGNDLPISLGLGAQLGPNLRRVTAAGLDETAQAWRWGGFLSVDIPLFNLYVR